MPFEPLFAALEHTSAGALIRESQWGFQIAVAFHLIGITVSAGIVAWWDLRLLGVSMSDVPVSTVYRRLMPIAFGGFLVMFVSGGFLLAGYATAAYDNVYFRMKMVALLLAAVNAAVYHRITERTVGQWDTGTRPPLGARLAGLTSLGLWTAVILAGRMMSYTMF
jgi:hypothetical protein